jgi:uncharacterized protein (DUF433 family)
MDAVPLVAVLAVLVVSALAVWIRRNKGYFAIEQDLVERSRMPSPAPERAWTPAEPPDCIEPPRLSGLVRPWTGRPSPTAREDCMTHLDHITTDPAICGGQPVVRGTRVLVRTVLGYLAHGETVEAILREFPTLQEADVRAVIAFAAASASEDLPAPSPIPPGTKVA